MKDHTVACCILVFNKVNEVFDAMVAMVFISLNFLVKRMCGLSLGFQVLMLPCFQETVLIKLNILILMNWKKALYFS